MKIEITLNDEDYIAYNIFHLSYSQQSRKMIRFGRWMMFMVSIMAIFIFVIAGADKDLIGIEAVMLLPVSIIWFIRYPKSAEKTIKKRINRLKKEGKLPYEPHTTLELSECEIIEKTEHSVSRYSYTDIKDVQRSGQYIYLIKGALEAVIIPVRYLDDEKLFEEWVRSKLQ